MPLLNCDIPSLSHAVTPSLKGFVTLTVLTLFRIPTSRRASQTHGNLLTVSLCKIRTQVTYVQYTVVWNKHPYSRREQGVHSKKSLHQSKTQISRTKLTVRMQQLQALGLCWLYPMPAAFLVTHPVVLASSRILSSSLQLRFHHLSFLLEPRCKHPLSTCSYIFYASKANTMWMMPNSATSPRGSLKLP